MSLITSFRGSARLGDDFSRLMAALCTPPYGYKPLPSLSYGCKPLPSLSYGCNATKKLDCLNF